MSTQNQRVLNYLKTHKSIDPLTAWAALGVCRLGARVWDLKRMGYRIETGTMKVANRFGEECRVARYELRDA